MAFTSDESGRFEVYVAPFPPTGGKTAVSAGIATGNDLQQGARWSHDGRELFYVSADRRFMRGARPHDTETRSGQASAALRIAGTVVGGLRRVRGREAVPRRDTAGLCW